MTNKYKEHEEKDIDMVHRLCDRFKNVGLVMPNKQREIYEAIRNEIVMTGRYKLKNTVCDVGCGTGIGSNILSEEAKFVWGIDKSEEHINFANQMFSRKALPQVTFDVVDILEFPRETMKFSIVAMIEVIEHIDDYQTALDFVKGRLCKNSTVLYISSPNRNSPDIQDDTPRNDFHVREWTAGEFYDVMIKNFKSVNLYKWDLTEKVDLDTKYTPLVAKCKGLL